MMSATRRTRIRADLGGACVSCRRVFFNRATWVPGRGTLCDRCRPLKKEPLDRSCDDALIQLLDRIAGVIAPPARRLSREEVEALYGAERLSPRYGEPLKSRALDG